MRSFIISCISAIVSLHAIAQIPLSPDNRQNPYDYIGINYNSGLDFVIRKYPNMSGQFFNENWKAIVSEFISSTQFDPQNFLNVVTDPKADQQCGNFSFYNNQTPEDELKKYFQQGLISKTRYDKVNEIYSLVAEIDELLSGSGGDAGKAYSIFYNKMLKLETGYQSLPGDDQAFCYTISSLARHSVLYWLNEGSKSQSLWGVPKSNTPVGMKFSWSRLGASDIGGAVAGTARYGVAGGFGGSGGSAAIGIIMIGAGIAASIGYIIFTLLGH